MRGNKPRIAVLLVLAEYVLALTAGAGFHVHEDHGCARQTAACSGAVAHHPANCRGKHSRDPVRCVAYCEEARGKSSPLCHGAERCLVCRFLAQKPVPSQPAVGVECRALSGQLAPVHPVYGAGNAPSTHHIRGPPTLA